MEDENKKIGICHRYPPSTNVNTQRYPYVREGEGCGEWKLCKQPTPETVKKYYDIIEREQDIFSPDCADCRFFVVNEED